MTTHRCDKIHVFSNAENHRAVFPGGEQFTVRKGGYNDNAKDPCNCLTRGKKSVFKIKPRINLFADKVGNNFCICIRLELIFFSQTVF